MESERFDLMLTLSPIQSSIILCKLLSSITVKCIYSFKDLFTF